MKNMEGHVVMQHMNLERLGSAIRRIAALAASAALALTGLAAAPSMALGEQTSPTGAKDVIVIAFQQNWESVARQCTDVYGPEGVGYVEVSPPQETIQGKQWWTSYQVASYKLDSKLGTQAQFESMIATCKAAGVGVIADAVINHTFGTFDGSPRYGAAGEGKQGSEYDSDGTLKATPGYTPADYHSCTSNISNYSDAGNVQNCRLSGLMDLDTGKPEVQEKIADYLNGLLKLGVYGFRVDAVKHIASADVTAIKTLLAQKSGRDADSIFFEQEVIGSASEAAQIQPANYLGTGKVSEFNFTNHLAVAFSSDITDESRGLAKVGGPDWVSSDKAAVFVTNWDTERGSALTYKKGSAYLLANAFMLANGYGQPHVYSGYYFNGNDDGAPGAGDVSVPDVTCPSDGSMTPGTWQCTERWTAIRGMIGYHNAVAGTAVSNWKTYGANVLGFGRGSKGYLAINNSDNDSHQSFATSLPAGTYCNVYATGDCSQTVDVRSDGSFTADLPAHAAIAIHVGATQGQWTGTQRRDPSDPDLARNDKQAKPATDTSRTVYYKLPAGWSSATLHYGIDNWQQQGDLVMQEAGKGWVSVTLDPKGKPLEYVFTNGSGAWDNPDGGGNYTALGHWTSVDNHAASAGIPGDLQPYSPKTKVIVHYKPADSAQRGVYLWATDKDGASIDGAHHAFTGTDSYGQVFETTLNGAFAAGKIGVIITDEQWNKVGDNRMIDGSNGTAEVWIDGSKPDETLSQAPAGYEKQFSSVNVTIHYHRFADDYASADGNKAWDIWGWSDSANGAAYPFSSHDRFGLTAKYTLAGSKPAFLVRYGGDGWEAKDPNGDNRAIPASAVSVNKDGSANAEIWLVQGDPTVYTNSTLLVTKDSIAKAQLDAFRTITVKLSRTTATTPAVTVDGTAAASVSVEGNALTVGTDKDLDVTAPHTVAVEGFGQAPVSLGAVVRSDAFDRKYAYDGDDLGATVNSKDTVFKLWAPTASKVELNLYRDDSEHGAKQDSIAMTHGTHGGTGNDLGVWTATVPGADLVYDYTLTFADGTVNQSSDPYAKASVVNGRRSVALAAKEIAVTAPRMKPFGKTSDAVIAETNIRDFSIAPNSGIAPQNKGKYLGMTQSGTTTPDGAVSGLDYLKKLGVTHVQIMPMYDYGSVDENTDLSYDPNNERGAQNWGYDPVNYDVPEGSYSSDPKNPATRIKELKEMVAGLHTSNIRVIMDVVYNHVQDAGTHAFNETVPGYYLRYDANGNLVNNSGVGNDTASERAMMRKYIVDSVTYWAKTYKLDGFRFDLMGLIDLKTMQEVRSALDKIDPSIIVLGEGWDMNTTMPKADMTIQPNAYEVAAKNGDNGIAFFNDSLRDALKGSVFNDTDTGFASGAEGKEDLIANNMMACPNLAGTAPEALCTNGNATNKYGDPGQVVQYAEIHDNLTLYDKLLKSVPRKDGQSEAQYQAEILARAKLVDSAVMLSQGTVAFQLGQEFLRTKGGDSNSYKSGDAVNAIDWDRTVQQRDSVAYMRGLIALRASVPALHMATYEDIAKNMTMLAPANGRQVSGKQIKGNQVNGVVAFSLTSGGEIYVVVLNANETAVQLPQITAGEYTSLVAGGKVETTAVTVGDKGYSVPALSAAVLTTKAASSKPEPSKPGSSNPKPDGSQPGDSTRPDGTHSSAHNDGQHARVATTGSSVAVIVVIGLVLMLTGAAVIIVRAITRKRR
jgi:pullulanase